MGLLDRTLGEERVWDMVALGSAALAGVAIRQALQGGWKLLKRDEPPTNPAARSVGWPDALAWTLAVGAAVGVGRMLAERGAAAGWRKVRGRYPKGLG